MGRGIKGEEPREGRKGGELNDGIRGCFGSNGVV
jgi:hypothetical protein